MTDRPILFSGPMVNAILEGRKTQTRRVLKPQPIFEGVKSWGESWQWNYDPIKKTGFSGILADQISARAGVNTVTRFKVGDRLYVREAWRTMLILDHQKPSRIITASHEAGYDGWAPTQYEADLSRKYWDGEDWPHEYKPGRFRQDMHMPRQFSRLTLVVTDVRVQRLQDISTLDAIAEGVSDPQHPDTPMKYDSGSPSQNVSAFATLWNSINDARGFGWDANPWVVAVTFETHHCNIDQMEV